METLLEVPAVVCLTAYWTKQLVQLDVPCVVAQGGLKDPPSRVVRILHKEIEDAV